MKTKVKAITSVMHGRFHLHAGDELEVTKSEADDLIKAGLAKAANEDQAPAAAPAAEQRVDEERAPAPVAQPGENPPMPDYDVEQLLGGAIEKMDEDAENKMDTDPENKTVSHRKATKAK